MKIDMIVNRMTHIHGRSYILVILSLIFSLSLCFVGNGGIRDCYWWIQESVFWRQNLMTCGFLFAEHLLIKLFGDGLLFFRLIAWTITISSLFFCFYFLSDKKERNYGYFALGIFLVGHCTGMQFSPDTLTVLFLVLASCFLYKYIVLSNCIHYIILVALFCAMATVYRFPNILTIPIITLLLTLDAIFTNCGNIYKEVKHILTYIIVSVFLIWMTYSLLGYKIGNISTSFSATATGTHSISSMLQTLYSRSIELFNLLGFIALYFFLSDFFFIKNLSNGMKWLFSFVLSAYVCLFYVLGIGFHKHNNYLLYQFVSMLAFTMGLVDIKRNLENGKREVALGVVSLLSICVVAMMGSDTAYRNMFPMTCCFIPFLGSMKPFHLSQYNIPSVICLLACILATYIGNPIGQTPIWCCRVESSCDKLRGIRFSEERESLVVEFMNVFEEYRDGDNNVAIGMLADSFRYFNDMSPKWNQGFYEELSSLEYLKKLEEEISVSHPVVFVCQNGVEQYDDFMSMMSSLGYRLVATQTDVYVFKVPNLEEIEF